MCSSHDIVEDSHCFQNYLEIDHASNWIRMYCEIWWQFNYQEGWIWNHQCRCMVFCNWNHQKGRGKMHHCSRSWVRSLATPLKSLVPLYIVGPALEGSPPHMNKNLNFNLCTHWKVNSKDVFISVVSLSNVSLTNYGFKLTVSSLGAHWIHRISNWQQPTLKY